MLLSSVMRIALLDNAAGCPPHTAPCTGPMPALADALRQMGHAVALYDSQGVLHQPSAEPPRRADPGACPCPPDTQAAATPAPEQPAAKPAGEACSCVLSESTRFLPPQQAEDMLRLPDGADVIHALQPFAPVQGSICLHHVMSCTTHPAAQSEPVYASAALGRFCNHPAGAVVHCGIDPQQYFFRADNDGYLLYAGTRGTGQTAQEHMQDCLLPQHSFLLAAGLARAAGLPLVVAAPAEQFANTAGNAHVSFAGSLTHAEYAQLLAGARALIHPALTPDWTGMAVLEALVSGTPVLCTATGALPEVCSHGVTGFFFRCMDDARMQLRHMDSINPYDCRMHVLCGFTHRHMAERCLSLYAQRFRQACERARDAALSARTGRPSCTGSFAV